MLLNRLFQSNKWLHVYSYKTDLNWLQYHFWKEIISDSIKIPDMQQFHKPVENLMRQEFGSSLKRAAKDAFGFLAHTLSN